MPRPAIPSVLVLATALALAPRPAAAEITASARAIVDRYVTAIGGGAALDSIRTVHRKGRIVSAGRSASR